MFPSVPGRPRAYAWDDPQCANGSKYEASSKYEREIEHASFQNRHNIFCLSVRCPWSLCCQGPRGVPLDMSRIHPERPDSDPFGRSVAADVLLRQEPEEEDEEEDGGDGKEDDDDDDKDDDGYSE